MPILTTSPTVAQLGRLYAIAAAHGLDSDDVKELVAQMGADDPKNLTRAQYDDLVDSVIPTMFPVDYPVRHDRHKRAHESAGFTDATTGEVLWGEDDLTDWSDSP